ncbi:immunoglobulin-like domain-containing protein [Bacillus sp. FJAT-42315]|uniref:immunoglobulin-like domain-containing protein n=1 Tax=Bacillus sp. FJAT-42315 TaxID=2014077 RepID=UPI000C24E67B|nr:immunoglobulin-like domain-containing protein [Bacillus sp. FJAT-42315]
MKKKRVILFTLLAVLFIGFMVLPDEVKVDMKLISRAYEQEMPSEADGISVKMEQEQYDTSTEKIIVLINNIGSEDINPGHQGDMKLQKKVGGTWREFPQKPKVVYEDYGILFPSGMQSSLVLSVDQLKYKLVPGEYRALPGAGVAAPFTVVED